MQLVKIKDIKPNPNNPRLIKDEKFKKLVKSIQDFPEMLKIRPIVVNSDMIVLGGNMRLKACKEAGLKEVHIIVADELTEEQQKEFIIKDNVGFGEWDWQALNAWDKEELVEWGLDIPDFEQPIELQAEEDDYQQPDNLQVDVVLGDLIEIGEHRLLCGDSTCSDTVAKLMNGEKADMVFTDPPYNVAISKLGSSSVWDKKTGKSVKSKNGIGQIHDEFKMASGEMTQSEFTDFLSSVFNNLVLFSTNGSIHFLCMDWRHIKELMTAGECYTELKNLCVWNKDNGGMGSFYRSKHELVFVYKNGNEKHINTFGLGAGGRYRTNVWDYPIVTSFSNENKGEEKLHPTPKPIKLVSDAILDCSNEGLIICDVFLGSGTTMVAAHQLKRKCYGMELDPKYCQVIIDRMKKLDPTLKVKINGIEYEQTKPNA